MVRIRARINRRAGRTIRRRHNRYMKRTRTTRSIVQALSVNKKGLHFFTRWCTLPSGNTNQAIAAGVGAALSQTADSWIFNTGTGAPGGVSLFSLATYFTLDMLPDYTEYTSMFDQYKIKGALYKITPYTSSVQGPYGAAATGSNQPVSCIIHSVIDADDANALPASSTGLNSMREYNTYKTSNFFKNGYPCINRFVYPRLATAAYGSGVFSSYANQKPLWIDANSPQVQHYGLKWIAEVFQPDTTTPVFIWFKIEVKLYFECRQPR